MRIAGDYHIGLGIAPRLILAPFSGDTTQRIQRRFEQSHAVGALPRFGQQEKNTAFEVGMCRTVANIFYGIIRAFHCQLIVNVELQSAQRLGKFGKSVGLRLADVQLDQRGQQFINLIQIFRNQFRGAFAVDDPIQQVGGAQDVAFADGLRCASQPLEQARHCRNIGWHRFFDLPVSHFLRQADLTLNDRVIRLQLAGAQVNGFGGFPITACQVDIAQNMQGFDIFGVICQNTAEHVQRICEAVFIQVCFAEYFSDL